MSLGSNFGSNSIGTLESIPQVISRENDTGIPRGIPNEIPE